MNNREIYLKLDVPIVPQPGHLVYVDEEKASFSIATVVSRLGNDPPRFDVRLADGGRAVAEWIVVDQGRGYWRAATKGIGAAS